MRAYLILRSTSYETTQGFHKFAELLVAKEMPRYACHNNFTGTDICRAAERIQKILINVLVLLSETTVQIAKGLDKLGG